MIPFAIGGYWAVVQHAPAAAAKKKSRPVNSGRDSVNRGRLIFVVDLAQASGEILQGLLDLFAMRIPSLSIRFVSPLRLSLCIAKSALNFRSVSIPGNRRIRHPAVQVVERRQFLQRRQLYPGC